jgi:hypothetical protein
VNEIKFRQLRCAKEVAEVPIQEVAKIAALLVREGGLSSDENNPLVVATAKAFGLLEVAYYGKSGLVNKGSFEAGLAEFVEGKRVDQEFWEGVAKVPKWEWQYDEHGKKLPVPFDGGLTVVIPKPGVKASETADERMVRFRAWLSDFYSEQEPDAEKRQVLVGNMIAEMKQKGIPPQLFTIAILQFPAWWEAHKSPKKRK